MHRVELMPLRLRRRPRKFSSPHQMLSAAGTKLFWHMLPPCSVGTKPETMSLKQIRSVLRASELSIAKPSRSLSLSLSLAWAGPQSDNSSIWNAFNPDNPASAASKVAALRKLKFQQELHTLPAKTSRPRTTSSLSQPHWTCVTSLRIRRSFWVDV